MARGVSISTARARTAFSRGPTAISSRIARTPAAQSFSVHSGRRGRAKGGVRRGADASPSARFQVKQPGFLPRTQISAGTKKTASPKPAAEPAEPSAKENPPTAIGGGSAPDPSAMEASASPRNHACAARKRPGPDPSNRATAPNPARTSPSGENHANAGPPAWRRSRSTPISRRRPGSERPMRTGASSSVSGEESASGTAPERGARRSSERESGRVVEGAIGASEYRDGEGQRQGRASVVEPDGSRALRVFGARGGNAPGPFLSPARSARGSAMGPFRVPPLASKDTVRPVTRLHDTSLWLDGFSACATPHAGPSD